MTEIPITFDGQSGSQDSAAAAAEGGAGPSGSPAHAAAAGEQHPPAGGEHAPTTLAEEQDSEAEAEAEEIEEDLSELVKKANQRDEYLAIAQRTQADFENYRKRVAKEASTAHERGAVSLAKELLPALDNLDRALEAAAEDDPLLQGVRLVRDEIAAALARAGIESFSPHGEQFDPALHEAVATAPASDGRAGGTVVEVYQAGYRCRENVIRPARVVVAA
jgi:molecular chaperone GrpE